MHGCRRKGIGCGKLLTFFLFVIAVHAQQLEPIGIAVNPFGSHWVQQMAFDPTNRSLYQSRASPHRPGLGRVGRAAHTFQRRPVGVHHCRRSERCKRSCKTALGPPRGCATLRISYGVGFFVAAPASPHHVPPAGHR